MSHLHRHAGLVFLVCCTLLISGCTSTTGNETQANSPRPKVSPERTVTSSPTVETIGTRTPTMSSTPTAMAEATRAPPASPTVTPVGNDTQLPDATVFRWEPLQIDGQTVQRLNAFERRVLPLGASPDGRWLGIGLKGDTSDASILMVDTQQNAHWWWNTDTYIFSDDSSWWHPWLPDGRVIQVDSTGAVFLGRGRERHSLDAPEPIDHIDYATDGIAFAFGQDGGLWRVELDTARWELVSDQIPHTTHAFSQDRAYMLVFADAAGTLWRVPTVPNTAATRTSLQQVDVIGSGAPLPPPTHLADSPYWLRPLAAYPQEPVDIDGTRVWRSGLLFDERDGRMVTLDDLAGLPIPDAYSFDPLYSTPAKGAWLAVEVWALGEDRRHIQRRALYVAPGSDLSGGRLVEDVEFAGWLSEPAAVIVRHAASSAVRDSETADLAMVSLPLSTDATMVPLNTNGEVIETLPNAVILRDPQTDLRSVVSVSDTHVEGPAPLDGSGEVLATDRQWIVTRAADTPARVLLFDVSGRLHQSFDLSEQYGAIRYALIVHDRIYLSVAETNDQACRKADGTGENPTTCTYALLEWSISPVP